MVHIHLLNTDAMIKAMVYIWLHKPPFILSFSPQVIDVEYHDSVQ